MLWIGIGFPVALIYEWAPNVSALSVSSSPSSCSSTSPGIVVWSNPENALSSNDIHTTASGIIRNTNSHELHCSGFDFSSIPNQAIIEGITVSVERLSNSSNGAVDYVAMLMKNYVKVGSNQATSTTIPFSKGIRNFGDASNLWGETWTASEIKQAGFGAIYQVRNLTVSNKTVSVDSVSITVNYSESAPLELSQGNYRFYASSDSSTPGSPLEAINQKATVPSAPGSGAKFESITTGVQSSCGLTADGTAYCWGFNGNGQLGDGTLDPHLVPEPVTTSVKFSQLSIGYYHMCGISTDGTAYCWGYNYNGRLGDGTTVDRYVPTPVDTSLKFSSIQASQSHSCALTLAGKAYCWGFNGNGQLGDGTTTNKLSPVEVETSLVFTSISASTGNSHTCGLIADGTAYCWGYNYNGQLGDGTTTRRLEPTAVLTSLKFTSIAATSAYHTCALTADGTAYCWGSNSNGQLGNDTYSYAYIPYAVDTSLKFTQIFGGFSYTCALTADGTAYCWGYNEVSQLGDNSTQTRYLPVSVATGLKFHVLSTGGAHTCSLTKTNSLAYCWGQNISGLLGDGTEIIRATPVAVSTLPDSTIMDNSFRLRLALTVEEASIASAETEEFRLEYAERTQSTCEAQTSGFAVVTNSTPIAWHSSDLPSDGSTVTANTSTDPVTTDVTYQKIIRSEGTFTNRTSASTDQHLLWDFALKNISESPGTSYCLRMTKGDGSLFEGGYQHVPEITTESPAEPPSISFRSSTDQVVNNPTFTMPALDVLSSCQSSSFTLGAGNGVKLRLEQGNSPSSGFSIVLAPSEGQSALWASQGGHYYDFNDSSGSPPGCSNGSDGDLYAGQLTVERSTSTLTPSSGCNLTGLSYIFSSSAFTSGSNDAITLIQGSSNVSTNCHWDLTGTGFSQTIPPAQPPGNYTLDLTITVVAS